METPFETVIAWKEAYELPVWTLAVMLVGLSGYYFSIISPRMERWVRGKQNEEEGQIRWALFQHYSGAICLGVPALIFPFLVGKTWEDFGMLPKFPLGVLPWAGAAAAFLIIMNIIRGSSPANLEQYPQIRAREWDLRLFLSHTLAWIVFLFGYELAFRGVMLYGLIDLGVWPAIAINTTIYILAHYYKGFPESFASLPFGIATCLLTLYSGSIWPAFLVHCCLSLSNMVVALRAHPDMKWVRKRGASQQVKPRT